MKKLLALTIAILAVAGVAFDNLAGCPPDALLEATFAAVVEKKKEIAHLNRALDRIEAQTATKEVA